MQNKSYYVYYIFFVVVVKEEEWFQELDLYKIYTNFFGFVKYNIYFSHVINRLSRYRLW